ncbi:MAG: hypothetical protein CEN91_13 [Candidatus Berkelbacteria bacterium Licking1014_85]|uniref:Uncharacterized protein n=1 Tax=Candidatus Berkelbacteria bacterium Licking1014_85 TaxID=2017148 RepID=A0A554LMV4_9BACT|nr:MAG: hypothetical protein CEN91_13 [Candidatus Berkelbacteria bacterium Licking1014_85]
MLTATTEKPHSQDTSGLSKYRGGAPTQTLGVSILLSLDDINRRAREIAKQSKELDRLINEAVNDYYAMSPSEREALLEKLKTNPGNVNESTIRTFLKRVIIRNAKPQKKKNLTC